MKIKHYFYLLSSVILTVLAVSLVAVAAGPDAHHRIQLDPTCSWSQAAVKFKKVIIENEGTLEPLHLSQGLVLLATAKQPKQAEAIRKAARALTQDFQKFRSEGTDTPCNKLLNASQTGTLSVQLEDRAEGVLVAYFSKDPAVTELLLSDCCDFCTCPNNGWRCQGCC